MSLSFCLDRIILFFYILFWNTAGNTSTFLINRYARGAGTFENDRYFFF